MILGSFTIDGEQINVQPDYSHIDGRFYHLTLSSGQEVAVTTYKGLSVPEGSPFDAKALQAGLRTVLRRSTRT